MVDLASERLAWARSDEGRRAWGYGVAVVAGARVRPLGEAQPGVLRAGQRAVCSAGAAQSERRESDWAGTDPAVSAPEHLERPEPKAHLEGLHVLEESAGCRPRWISPVPADARDLPVERDRPAESGAAAAQAYPAPAEVDRAAAAAADPWAANRSASVARSDARAPQSSGSPAPVAKTHWQAEDV